MLKKMKKVWPQFELDGDRNVWIVKPGDKSKGVGKSRDQFSESGSMCIFLSENTGPLVNASGCFSLLKVYIGSVTLG